MTQNQQDSASPQDKPAERPQTQQQQQRQQPLTRRGRSGTGTDSVLEQLKHWEQSRAADSTDDADGHPG